jgi:hypothetical protein
MKTVRPDPSDEHLRQSKGGNDKCAAADTVIRQTAPRSLTKLEPPLSHCR